MAELGRYHCAFGINRENAYFFKSLGLESLGVAYRLGDSVPGHVEVSEAKLAHAGVRGAVLHGAHEAVNEFLGYRLAGLVMAGEAVEKLFFGEVVLVELRRKFHEVAVYRGARK